MSWATQDRRTNFSCSQFVRTLYWGSQTSGMDKNIVLSDFNNKVATLEEFLIYLLWFEYFYVFHGWVWHALAPLLLLTSWFLRCYQGLEGYFSGSGIWPKYGAGFGKTQNILTRLGIWLLHGKRDSPKFGYRMQNFLPICRELRKVSWPK